MCHSTVDTSRYVVQCVSHNWCAINIALLLCKYCITITFDLDIYAFPFLYVFFLYMIFFKTERQLSQSKIEFSSFPFLPGKLLQILQNIITFVLLCKAISRTSVNIPSLCTTARSWICINWWTIIFYVNYLIICQCPTKLSVSGVKGPFHSLLHC